MAPNSGLSNFYPRSPRGERPAYTQRQIQLTEISIHAPREGSDAPACGFLTTCRYFYPRSPRGERLYAAALQGMFGVFLSTLPARGATEEASELIQAICISIHAPREGSDRPNSCRLPAGFISIHAPREGSDASPRHGHKTDQHFYPRSPRGERLQLCVQLVRDYRISIHAPREGSDVEFQGCGLVVHQFLSTLPARGATQQAQQDTSSALISIHAPREGSDRRSAARKSWPGISIHAPREGSDSDSNYFFSTVNDFYPRSPRGERLG